MWYSAAATLRGQKQRSLATRMCLLHNAVAKQELVHSMWVCDVLSAIFSDSDIQNQKNHLQRAGFKQDKAIFRSVVLAD